MNRAYTYLLVFCSIAVLFATSCKKAAYNSSAVASVNTDESKLNQLFSGFRATPQNIAVDAGSSHVVYCLNGTRLAFYPNSFKDKNGATIPKGKINLQITEAYTPGDMIASRVATTFNGQLLTSGGQVQIVATMDGEEVFANKYGIGFRQRTPTQEHMSLYYGDAGNADSVITWGTPPVQQNGTFVTGTVTMSDTALVVIMTTSGTYTLTTHTAPITYYQFDSCANFNWVNCDYFYTSGAQLTDVRVMLPDTSFNQSNTEVYLVFPTINAAARMTEYTSSSHTFHLAKGYYIPVGMQVDVVVAANKNGGYYYFQQDGVNTDDNMFLFAQMSIVSLDYIRAQLQNL